MSYRKDKKIETLPDDPSTLAYEIIETDESELTKKFNFMTTVSIPVYDKRDNAVSMRIIELRTKFIFSLVRDWKVN
jgi:hypothetical protein